MVPFSDERLHDAVRHFRQVQSASYRVDRLIGQSPAIARARDQVVVAVDSMASVLIVGPEGSGKEQVAKTIMYRGREPYGTVVPLACAGLGVELLVATLARAVHDHPHLPESLMPDGTILLRDVDELPIEVQREFARLLTVERTSLRVVSTSCRSLEELVSAGSLRSDLAYALSTITIAIPPLRHRLEDLPLLSQVFLEEQNALGGKQVASLSSETLDLLTSYTWPGNLDELTSVIREAHQQATGPIILPKDLPKRITLASEAALRPKRIDEPIMLEDFLARVERELIERALVRAKGNKTRAAKLLGMTRPKLYRRLVQLKLI
jgi:DNA-binding NtrC family response regulator